MNDYRLASDMPTAVDVLDASNRVTTSNADRTFRDIQDRFGVPVVGLGIPPSTITTFGTVAVIARTRTVLNEVAAAVRRLETYTDPYEDGLDNARARRAMRRTIHELLGATYQ